MGKKRGNEAEVRGGKERTQLEPEPEEGPYEDPFEDEIEEEEIFEGESDADVEMGQEEAGEETPVVARPFRPGLDKVEEGEELVMESSAYVMYHALRPEWPCLSFDIFRDSLGQNRTRFPHTMYLVAGTQADRADRNKLMCMKLSDMHKTQNDADSQASDSEVEDEDPVIQSRDVPHHGGINRLKCMPQQSGIVATWADTGKVLVTDVSEHMASLERTLDRRLHKPSPLFSFGGHATEGFALAWSPLVQGRLASGDCAKYIYVHEPQSGGWTVNKVPYSGHTSSVEDIQWSPVQQNVFASASADSTVRLWDARNRAGAAVSFRAHDTDVNVISWNTVVDHLLVSGADDGSFRIWDIRKCNSPGTPMEPAAHFKWHTRAISSVEWHPSDGSVVAVSGADDQATIWDLSLELDDGDLGQEGIPPQLLFVHQGQEDIKEVHWHSQISNTLVTTALSGFNVFRPDTFSTETTS